MPDHALAIQIDFDEEEALAGRLAVWTLPTVVAMRDGREEACEALLERARPSSATLHSLIRKISGRTSSSGVHSQ